MLQSFNWYYYSLIIHKTYKQKLILTVEQIQLCEKFSGCSRQLYNAAIQQREMAYRLSRTSVRRFQQDKELKSIKECFSYFKEVPHQVLQQTLRDVDKAYQNFFKRGSGYPKFRSKYTHNTIRYSQNNVFHIRRVSRRKGHINLTRLGTCKFYWTQKIKGRPLSATVKKEAGEWYISILCELEVKDKPVITAQTAKSAIGVDRGCRNLVATSGSVFENAPSHLSQLLHIKDGHLVSLQRRILKSYKKKIKKKQRKLAFKKKGSRAFKKTKLELSKLHHQLAGYRKDALHQLSIYLVKNQDLIFLEDLDVKAMTKSNKRTKENPGTDVAKKRRLNEKIQTQGWGYLRAFLKYKSEWQRKLCQSDISPAYTSQKCSLCTFTDKKNRQGDVFLCLHCGHRVHADVNAAKNILRAGLAQIASKSDEQRLLWASGLLGISSINNDDVKAKIGRKTPKFLQLKELK